MGFELKPYTPENLANALSNKYTSSFEIQNKRHYNYLLSYFAEPSISPQTIVIEKSYISKDYLIDYTNYFATCYRKYPKRCKRVHFFRKPFEIEEFVEAICTNKADCKDLWESYIGFIVVKPIPINIIGFTVLEEYPQNSHGNSRYYFGSRDYEINVFGSQVIKRSIGFQEQDSIVGACATAAIWTALQKSNKLGYSASKTPSEITKDADTIGTGRRGRLYPNTGLSVSQIISAFNKSGLVCEVKTSGLNSIDARPIVGKQLLASIYAYSKLGVPIIVGLKVPIKDKSDDGHHAVAVTGFRKSEIFIPPVFDKFKLFLVSDAIDKLFIHDDQYGPFAKVDVTIDSKEVVTEWTKDFGKPSSVIVIIVPIYHKIRISYENIEAIIEGYNTMFNEIFFGVIDHNFTWEISVLNSEEVKKEFKSVLTGHKLLERLIKSYPKYIWRVNCFYKQDLAINMLFDATDLKRNMFGISILYLKDDIKLRIQNELSTKKENYSKFIGSHPKAIDFINFLLES